MSWPQAPVVYEVNTAVWLDALSRTAGRPLTLSDVAPADWDAVCPEGADAVWLMGVWERSPAGLVIAMANEDLQASFRESLPDVREEDVFGSPYCVRRYVADPAFGGTQGLADARSQLAARDMRLVLDYVPNHVAPDHPWVTEHPERFVRGSAQDLEADPSAWLAVGSDILAHGRDPYFPAWPDVVQLDAFSPDLRDATVATLGAIAEQCDGIRCDMAMLMINNVFAKTWGGRTGPEPQEEFWPTVIGALRVQHPQTVLLAEAYWEMEWELQQQGFDFCYDKRLYDRLVEGQVDQARGHLHGDLAYQARLVRFLENHDEPRIASVVGRDAQRAAAVAIATLPGATLWYEGQFEGRRVRPSVFLRRRPDEELDEDLAAWHRRLLPVAREVRTGDWCLLDVEGWVDNDTCRNLVAWAWDGGGSRYVVVVNLSGAPAQARVRMPWPDLHGRSWQLSDLLGGTVVQRGGDEMADSGLFVALDAWQSHLFAVR